MKIISLFKYISFAAILGCHSYIAISADFHVHGNLSGTGKYPAIATQLNTLPANVVYMPAKLPNKALNIILWGNGGCRDNGLQYARFLREISSHGYLVIAAGRPVEELFDLHTRKKMELENQAESSIRQSPPVGRPDATTVQQLLDGLTWADTENSNSESPFFQKLNTSRVAVMGHSCGGLQAVQVATDKRIAASIIFNSGVINDPQSGQQTALQTPKSILDKLHSPVAYINGGPEDVAYFNALDDFERLSHIPVFFAENGVGHGGTFHYPDGGSYAKVALHWLNWHLKGDADSKAWFYGDNCTLCLDMDWLVQQKRMH